MSSKITSLRRNYTRKFRIGRRVIGKPSICIARRSIRQTRNAGSESYRWMSRRPSDNGMPRYSKFFQNMTVQNFVLTTISHRSQKENLKLAEAQEEQRLLRCQKQYIELEMRKFRRKKMISLHDLETQLLRDVSSDRNETKLFFKYFLYRSWVKNNNNLSRHMVCC